MDEIRDTETDRRAVRYILRRAFPETRDVGMADIATVNEAWARVAAALADMPDERFSEILDGLTAEAESMARAAADPRGQVADAGTHAAAYDRAQALLTLIVDWRWQAWAASEVEAGRDPYVASPA